MGLIDLETSNVENAVHLLPPYACKLAVVGMRDLDKAILDSADVSNFLNPGFSKLKRM